MSEKRILELFNSVDEKYIAEAAPRKVKMHKFRINPMIAAACLCLFVMVGGVLRFMQPDVDEKYYATNMAEVMAIYEGELLAEKISYESAKDTAVLLCYTGDELPLSSEWKTLSVSASYENYDMTLNCAFNGEAFSANGDKAIDTI